METVELNNVIEQLENGQLSYNQFYNAEIDTTHYYSTDYYSKHNQTDNLDVDQPLKIMFCDIEVYKCDLEQLRIKKQTPGPINSVCIFDSKSKCYYLFGLIMMTKNYQLIDIKNPKQYEDQFTKELRDAKYIKEDENIRILFYIDEELKMLEDLWILIHKIDPAIHSGFNFDQFDLPYMYYRLKYLCNNDDDRVNKILSKFGIVKVRGFGGAAIQIPEYPICDIRRLYMPRDEMGLNYGKKLANYSLDNISDVELGLKKIEHTDLSFDQLYERNPIDFFKYNIGDVALTVRLNDKLKHIELHNMLRRDMQGPFTSSLIGSSSIFSSMFNYKLKEDNIGMRWGLLQEQTDSISPQEIESIEKPKEKSIKWDLTEINERTYRKLLSRFVGAYVKDGLGKILTIKDGILVDLDASLPPWEKISIRRDNHVFPIDIEKYEWKENDETLTWDNNNKVCWKKVKGKTEHNWNNKLITILTEYEQIVTVTNNHSVFGSITNNINDVKLIHAEDLKIGDYVIINNYVDEIILMQKIRRIEIIDYKGKVYDLSVEETERFFAGSGIGVHNTALYPLIYWRHPMVTWD